MQIIIHRGTHQIGGVAVEISTSSSRILIDMGEELGMDKNFTPSPLAIAGVTDDSVSCDGVLFTHNHADHIGQLKNIRPNIPLYMGRLAKEILLKTLPKKEAALQARIAQAHSFTAGRTFHIGDIAVTPFLVDHSACDSYMFLLEADGKRVLHTGDFRAHGFRGTALNKMLAQYVGRVDVLIIEGTVLSRPEDAPMTERQLQQKLKEYIKQYKYIFVLCASTNLERICAFSKAVPKGKYFLCDRYQYKLLEVLEQHWGAYCPLYSHIKKTLYSVKLQSRLEQKGFVMMVRDNRKFREIIRRFNPELGLILYSMWDGYRTQEGSTIEAFLHLTKQWASLHTSGHAGVRVLQQVIAQLKPAYVIPIHTQAPRRLQELCPTEKVLLLQDAECFSF